MVFHQASRYYITKKCIETVGNNPQTMLEFGAGCHFNLKDVFPDSEITFLDLNMPEDFLDGYHCVKGDVTDLPYGDDAFDFLIGLDVLEHIPMEKREDAIKNIVRVSKKGFFISFPIGDGKNDIEDSILELYYRQLHILPPVWIHEHIDCSLPDVETIKNLILQSGIKEENIRCIFGADMELSKRMLFIEAMASKAPIYKEYFALINEFYVNYVLPYDFSVNKENQGKAYILACKKQTAPDLKFLIKEKHRIEIDKFILRLENEEKRLWYTNFSDSLIKPAPVIEQDKNRVTVILVSYNHAKYIAEALNSIIRQVTSFKFNIMVADDCSSDATLEIIKEYDKKTNIEFIYLERSHNLGTMQNYKKAFAACNAEYIAIMEGDDYWTDRLRLQKMCDFLDIHEECSMVFNRYNVDNGRPYIQPPITDQWISDEYTLFTGYDLAYDNLIGNFSTCMYRNTAIQSLPGDLYDMPCYDWLTNICVSQIGKIGCLADVMSTYRIHKNGLWSGKRAKEQNREIIEIIDVYDKYTNYEFHEGFQAHKIRLMAYRKTWIKNLLFRIYEWIPPVFVYMAKAIIPPRFVRGFKK